MRPLLVPLVCAGLLAAAPRKEDAPTDAKALQGTWTVTAAEMRTEKMDEVVGSTFTFDGEKVTIQIKVKKEATGGTFKLDPAASPKAIDVMTTGEAKTVLGVYKIDGNTLTLCIGDRPEEPRPTKFETHKEKKLVLLVLKREKK